MSQPEPIDISIIDAKDIKKIQEKQEKIQWVMEQIRESGLDKDEEFMDEVEGMIQALKEEK
jgi:hypothetical protein